MNSTERREEIIKLLHNSEKPIKGNEIANKYNVTRQVIVRDIAILRAKSNNIIATPDGYIINRDNNLIKTIIAVNHSEEEMFKELNIIIKYGGIIEDVIVEHPLYGEIKGMLMIKNYNELDKFLKRYKEFDAKLLSVLTNGVHLHTVSVDSEENLELIIKELKEENLIISD